MQPIPTQPHEHNLIQDSGMEKSLCFGKTTIVTIWFCNAGATHNPYSTSSLSFFIRNWLRTS